MGPAVGTTVGLGVGPTRGPATEVAGNERHEAPRRALSNSHRTEVLAEPPKGDFPGFVAAVSTAALQAQASGQSTTDFAYEALGRRLSRTAGGTPTEFVYGAGDMVLGKQGGSTTQAYTQGNGLLCRGSEYPMFDGHGSERTVTSSSPTVTGSVSFEAFRQVAGSSGSTPRADAGLALEQLSAAEAMIGGAGLQPRARAIRLQLGSAGTARGADRPGP